MDEPILLTPAETADLLGIDVADVHQLVADGHLVPEETPRGKNRFNPTDVARYATHAHERHP